MPAPDTSDRSRKRRACPECGSDTDYALVGLDEEMVICGACGWEEPRDRRFFMASEPSCAHWWMLSLMNGRMDAYNGKE